MYLAKRYVAYGHIQSLSLSVAIYCPSFSVLSSLIANILWRVSPMRELLKRGASKQARNRRRSVYSSLLSNTRNRRKSSHASPSSLVATQHRGKSISAAVGRHATIAATFSVRSALTNSTRRCSPRVRFQRL
jgi:hypothetical protein